MDLLPGVDHLVNADRHIFLVPGPGGGVVLHMGSGGEGEDGAGIDLAVTGIDAAIFPVQRWHQRPADAGDQKPAVGGDRADHEA